LAEGFKPAPNTGAASVTGLGSDAGFVEGFKPAPNTGAGSLDFASDTEEGGFEDGFKPAPNTGAEPASELFDVVWVTWRVPA